MAESLHRKIVDAPQLAQNLREVRDAGSTVIQCHGCFDIVHPGHIRYLQFARQLGDVLVVSLTGDAGISKGVDRPYLPQELRAENLAALELVDWVVIDPHPTAVELLETLRPDVYVKGREYAASDDPRFVQEREIVERYGGRVVFHSGDVVFSSTRLIESLDRESALDEVRLRTLCVRNDIDLHSTRKQLAAFRDTPVVVCGDVVRETYVLCDPRDSAGDGPAPALQELGQRTYWGGAAAVALQLKALGARPTLVTTIGDDANSQRLRDKLSQLEIECQLFTQRDDLVTHDTFVADDTKLFNVTRGATCPLDSAWEHRLLADLQGRIRDAAALVWCELGYGAITPGLVRTLSPVARRAGCRVVGGVPGHPGDIHLLVNTDLLTLSERRLRTAMHDLGSSVPSVVWRLLDRTHGRAALVALHKRGIIGFDGRPESVEPPIDGADVRPTPARLRSEFVPTHTRHFVDPRGLDEAVLAIASLTLSTGGTLPMAAYLACAAEAYIAPRVGRTSVSLDDLHRLIQSRPELRPESRFLPDAATLSDIAQIAPPLAVAEVSSETT